MPLNQPITQWQGRSVWLIGASSGIGLATAKALHAAGARITVSARKTDLLDTFVASHAGSQAIALDVCDAQAVHAVTKQVAQTHGIDVVVAGGGGPSAARSFGRSHSTSAAAPAPACTVTRWPRATSSRAPVGVRATRYSPSLISFGIPIIISDLTASRVSCFGSRVNVSSSTRDSGLETRDAVYD